MALRGQRPTVISKFRTMKRGESKHAPHSLLPTGVFALSAPLMVRNFENDRWVRVDESIIWASKMLKMNQRIGISYLQTFQNLNTGRGMAHMTETPFPHMLFEILELLERHFTHSGFSCDEIMFGLVHSFQRHTSSCLISLFSLLRLWTQ